MGRSYTPKYRVEYRDNTMNRFAASKWLTYDAKRLGKPSDASAEKLRQSLNKSFAPGGVNWNVSVAAGVVVHVQSVKIVRQADNEVVATATAPMFEVV